MPLAHDSLILPCPGCGALNRVPRDRLADVPICSGCRRRLVPDAPIELDGARFDRCVDQVGLPVVVDFWAPWCGPCRTMEPELRAAAVELVGSTVLAKVDTEQHPDLATRFEIRGIPTLVVLDHGLETARVSGAMTARQITAWVRETTRGARTSRLRPR